MADSTLTELASLPAAQIAAGDELVIWDVSAGQTKKATRADVVGGTLTGGGVVNTGGKTLNVPADGTAALLEAVQTFTSKEIFAVGVTSGTQPSTNDDSAFWIVTPSNVGMLVLMVSNLASAGGMIAFRCQSGFVGQAVIISSAAGTILDTRVDQVLSGTTGTDGKITVSSNANDGRLYIENRSGGARVFSWFFITN